MALPRRTDPVGMLFEAQNLSGMLQGPFAEAIGTSKRSWARWMNGSASPYPMHLAGAARVIYRVDRDLSDLLARAGQTTLIALGLELPPAPPVPPPPPAPVAPSPPPRRPPSVSHLVDSVVCAAAEAIGVTPQTIRPALRAAFARVTEVDLTPAEVSEGLVAPAANDTPGAVAPPTK